MPFEVLLVDDHQILRDCLRAILARHPEFHVAGEAASGSEAVTLCRRLKPDLVVMDLELPGMNGLEAAAEMLRHCPLSKVVILSMRQDQEAVRDALRCGARSYLLLNASSSELLEALRITSEGGSYLSPQLSAGLLENLQVGFLERQDSAKLAGLTRREIQMLRLLASGKVNKDIAVWLGIQLTTVRTYRKRLMHKLGVRNVAGLTRVALSAGFALTGAVERPPAAPAMPADPPEEARKIPAPPFSSAS